MSCPWYADWIQCSYCNYLRCVCDFDARMYSCLFKCWIVCKKTNYRRSGLWVCLAQQLSRNPGLKIMPAWFSRIIYHKLPNWSAHIHAGHPHHLWGDAAQSALGLRRKSAQARPWIRPGMFVQTEFSHYGIHLSWIIVFNAGLEDLEIFLPNGRHDGVIPRSARAHLHRDQQAGLEINS